MARRAGGQSGSRVPPIDMLHHFPTLYAFAAFWVFVASREYRRRCASAWQSAGLVGRLHLALEATVSAALGLGPLLLLLALCAR